MPADELQSLSGLIAMSAGAAALVAVILSGRLRPSALRAAPPRRAGLGGFDLAMGMCVFFVGAYLAGVVLGELGLAPGDDTAALTAGQQAVRALLSQALMHGLMVLFIIVRAGHTDRGLHELGLVPRAGGREARAAGWGLLVAVPMVMGLIAVVSIVGQALGCEPPSVGHEMLDVLGQSDSTWATVALIGSAVVVAPVVEEIVFRGLVQSALLDLFGRAHRWRVILCAALPFTAIHIGSVGWQTLPGLFALAVVLGWLYERHGSLLPCVLVHAGFNACNIALMFALMRSGP